MSFQGFQTVYWLAWLCVPSIISSSSCVRRAHATYPSTCMPVTSRVHHPHLPRRGPPLLAAALRPAHWPLGGGSNGSGVLLALLARLPLGLHIALDLSLVGLRRWPLFGHPPNAEVKEAPLPGRPVISGRPEWSIGRPSIFPAPNKPSGVNSFGALRYGLCSWGVQGSGSVAQTHPPHKQQGFPNQQQALLGRRCCSGRRGVGRRGDTDVHS
jgi:hypothetical protein